LLVLFSSLLAATIFFVCIVRVSTWQKAKLFRNFSLLLLYLFGYNFSLQKNMKLHNASFELDWVGNVEKRFKSTSTESWLDWGEYYWKLGHSLFDFCNTIFRSISRLLTHFTILQWPQEKKNTISNMKLNCFYIQK
jgi:hypothetical protein